MGGLNSIQSKQDFYNNIFQQNQQICKAKTNVEVSGNVVVVNGSRVNGDVIGVNVNGVTTDANCIMQSAMQNNITDVLKSIANQTNTSSTSWFDAWRVGINVDNLRQTVHNNISQVSQQLCDATTSTTADDNYLYVGSTSVGGNIIGVDITNTNTNANCTMVNTMKNVVYNQAQSQVTQSNTQLSMFLIIGIVVVIVIGIIILVIVFLLISGIFKNIPKPNTNQPDLQQLASKLVTSNSATVPVTPTTGFLNPSLPPLPSLKTNTAASTTSITPNVPISTTSITSSAPKTNPIIKK